MFQRDNEYKDYTKKGKQKKYEAIRALYPQAKTKYKQHKRLY